MSGSRLGDGWRGALVGLVLLLLSAGAARAAQVDDPVVGFESESLHVEEGAGAAELTVQLAAPLDHDVQVPFRVETAAGDADVSVETPSPLTIPAGEVQAVLRLAWKDDVRDEPEATVVVVLDAVEGLRSGGQTCTLAIADDDLPPTVVFRDATTLVTEAGPAGAIEVELSAVSGFDVEVPFEVDGELSTITDVTLGASPLVIPAGERSATIAVLPLDDTLHEAEESLLLVLGPPTNAGLGARAQHTLTVADDDDAPTVELSPMAHAFLEGAGTLTFELRLSEPSGQDVVVPYTLAGDALPLEDYTADAGPLVIPAGDLTAGVKVHVVDDERDEDDEDLTFALGAPTNATLGAVLDHTVTITDDDATPRVELDAAARTVGESAGQVTIVVSLSGPSSFDVVVPFELDGDALSGEDYSCTSSPLTIPAGAESGEITLQIADDALDEDDEWITVRLGAPTGSPPRAELGQLVSQTITVEDDDDPPSVRFEVPTTNLGEAAGTVYVRIVLSAPSGLDVTVPFTVGGNASLGDDYGLGSGSPVVIPAGTTHFDLPLQVADDVLHEIQETVVLELGAPQAAKLGSLFQHVATITSDDPPPAISFAAATSTASEGTGGTLVQVRLSAVSGADVRVELGALSGSGAGLAQPGKDFSLPEGDLVIPQGQLAVDAHLTLVGDALHEGPELAAIALVDPVGAELGPTAIHELVLLDDDPAPNVHFEGPLVREAPEEQGVPVTLVVALDAPSGLDVVVPIFADGVAEAGEDYQLFADTVVIPAGQTKGAIELLPLDDDDHESGKERVVVHLAGPAQEAHLTEPSAVAVLLVDDEVWGEDGGLTLDLDRVTFSTTRLGESSQTQSVVLTNDGEDAVVFEGFELQGPDAGAFHVELLDQVPFSIEPGSTTTVSIAYQPLHTGPAQAALRVLQSFQHGPDAVVHLSGVALGPPGDELWLNAGPQAYYDQQGRYWSPSFAELRGVQFVTVPCDVEGTDEVGLYQSARVGQAFGWSLPVPAGEYEVVLHFAEIERRAPGERRFDVAVEGEVLVDDLDLAATVGTFQALRTDPFRITVLDGQFDLTVFATQGEGLLSGFELRSVPLVRAGQPSIDFGVVSQGLEVERGLTLRNGGLAEGRVEALEFRMEEGTLQSSSDFRVVLGGHAYAGGEGLVRHEVDLALPADQEVALPVQFQPTCAQSGQFTLAILGTFGEVCVRVAGATGGFGSNGLQAVIDVSPSTLVDFDGDGRERALLSGKRSRTESPTGHIAQYQWALDGAWAGEGAELPVDLPLGETTVQLTVRSGGFPSNSATIERVVRVHSPQAVPGVLSTVYDWRDPEGCIDDGDASSWGHPEYAERLEHLRVVDRKASAGRFEHEVLVRLQASFVVASADEQYEFTLVGGTARSLHLDGKLTGATVPLKAGRHTLDARFVVSSRLELPLTVVVHRGGELLQEFDHGLAHDESQLAPVLHGLSLEGGPALQDGLRVALTGFAFVPTDGVRVEWAGQLLPASALSEVGPQRLTLPLPPGTGLVPVRVVSPQGTSKALTFAYGDRRLGQ